MRTQAGKNSDRLGAKSPPCRTYPKRVAFPTRVTRRALASSAGLRAANPGARLCSAGLRHCPRAVLCRPRLACSPSEVGFIEQG